jgi:hypothetical protein
VSRKYEYLVKTAVPGEYSLEDLGKEGWELIIATQSGKWIFKRPLEPEKECHEKAGRETGFER